MKNWNIEGRKKVVLGWLLPDEKVG